jgi:hypothetical protein
MWLTLGLLTWFGLVAVAWNLQREEQGKLTPLDAIFLMVVGPIYVVIAIYIAIALFSGAPSAVSEPRTEDARERAARPTEPRKAA